MLTMTVKIKLTDKQYRKLTRVAELRRRRYPKAPDNGPERMLARILDERGSAAIDEGLAFWDEFYRAMTGEAASSGPAGHLPSREGKDLIRPFGPPSPKGKAKGA